VFYDSIYEKPVFSLCIVSRDQTPIYLFVFLTEHFYVLYTAQANKNTQRKTLKMKKKHTRSEVVCRLL